jgi:hypothetical protein
VNDDPKKQLEAAQRAADEAEERLALEQRRVEATTKELEALDEQLRLADPDDEKSFGRIVAAQGVARARLAALQERVVAAQGFAEAAAGPLAEATRAAAGADLVELAAKREQQAVEIIGLAKAFRDKISAHLAEHQASRWDDAVREMERKAGASVAESPLDRFPVDDLPRVFAGILHHLAQLKAVENERQYRETPAGRAQTRREEEAFRLAREREAEQLAEQNAEGDLGKTQRVYIANPGPDDCLTD